ncbi:MAG: hypothetical protein K8S27_06035 [Candidatus Omnitrophica bacterium]|nr:hypothetical protein [Candidatus Omnitrophota bacterium]
MKLVTKENASILLAGIAILISIRSCQLSKEATALDKREFVQQRMLTLTASIDNKKEELQVKPTENDKILLAAKIIFPNDIIKNAIQIKSPEFKFSLINLKYQISEKINEVIQRIKDQAIIIDNASIPVIIESHYAVKGLGYIDRSLYKIEYMAFISDKEYEPPTIEFTGLLFMQHLLPEENAVEALNDLWVYINENSTIKLNHLTSKSIGR